MSTNDSNNSNALSQALLDYGSIISTYAANNTGAAKTIKAQIVEEKDASNHEYKISYGGAEFSKAYAIGDVKYDTSTVVYVLIPSGDFDQEKWILGSVSPVASNYVTEEKGDSYIDVSENLYGSVQQKIKNQDITNEIYLCTWKNENFSNKRDKTTENYLIVNNEANFGTLFLDYSYIYKTFKMSFLIQTNIDINHKRQGKYGLELVLPFINTKTNETKDYVYTMDIDNLEGDPFDYNVFQKQEIYFTIDDGFEYDTTRSEVFQLRAYTSDFKYSEDEIKKINKNYDIVIKDISLSFTDVLTEDDIDGYHVTIVSDSGNYFLPTALSGPEIKTLHPVLKVKGKTASLEDWDCYWFQEDAAVNTTNHMRYLQIGGFGFKCVNDLASYVSDFDFQYVKNQYEIQVPKTEVAVELRYKCVLTKTFETEDGKQTIVTPPALITLKNFNSRVELYLDTKTGSTAFVENIGNINLLATIRTDVKLFTKSADDITSLGYDVSWARFDKDNNNVSYEKLGLGVVSPFYKIVSPIKLINEQEETINNGANKITYYFYQTEISFPCSLINEKNTIYCTFYRIINNVEKINLGTRHILVTVGKEATYTINLVNTDIVYKYDSDGDSPMIANYDGPNSSQINQTLPISFQIFKPTGHELTEEEYKYVKYEWYLPLNSLMEFEKVEKNNIDESQRYFIVNNAPSINYRIAAQYDKSKAKNNNIRLKINFDGNEFWASANPKFIKDGENGTNGSKYTAIIKYKDYDGEYEYGEKDIKGIRRKLHMVYVNEEGKGWYIHNQKENYITGNSNNHAQPLPVNTAADNNKLPFFTLSVYRDGAKIDASNLKITWEMYDIDNITKKDCFTIKQLNQSQSNGTTINLGGRLSIKSDAAGKWRNGENPCSIVRCKITINTEQSTTNLGISNQEVIYAYYPIEVTFLDKYPTSEYPMIPTLNGGFSEVIYDMDGNNPEWDKNNAPTEDLNLVPRQDELADFNFEFVTDTDRIKNNTIKIGNSSVETIYNYKWEVSKIGNYGELINGNLKIKKTKDQFAKIEPATKYASGVSNNYIKVSYTWNNKTRDAINEIIEKEREKVTEALKKKEKYIGKYATVGKNEKGDYTGIELEEDKSIKQYEYTPEEGDYKIVENGNVQNMEALYPYFSLTEMKKLDNSLNRDFLNYIVNGLETLKEIADILNEWLNFCKDNSVLSKILLEKAQYNYQNMYNNIYINYVVLAYETLYNLGFQDYSLSKLKILKGLSLNGTTLVDFSIRLTKKQENIVQNEFPNDAYNVIHINFYADRFETEVAKYNNIINSLQEGKTIVDDLIYDTNCIYKQACQDLGNIKAYASNIIKLDAFKNLYDNFDDIEGTEITNKKDRTDFYDDDGTLILNVQNIDSFKHILQELSQTFVQTEQVTTMLKNQKTYSEKFTYDYISNYYLLELRDTFMKAYGEDQDAQRKYYEEVQNKIFDYIKECYKKINSYSTLLNDQAATSPSIHIKPIIMFKNRAGLGYLNSWDGNRLYIDSKNEQYILAPLMGAGLKDNDGDFTGVVMGVKSLNKTDKKKQLIGLHGFSKNETSFFINAEDGSAIFGKSGGQIIIDPRESTDQVPAKAYIYSSNYWEDYGEDLKPINYTKANETGHGMLINLSDSFIHLGNDLSSQNTIGRIYSGEHSTLADNKNIGFYLSHEGLSIQGSYDQKDENGNVILKNAVSRFEINTKGAPKIYSGNHTALKTGTSGFYLGDDGLAIGTDFVIYANGSADILKEGSNIGGWRVKTKEVDGKKVPIGLVSENNSGILLDSTNSSIVLGSSLGKIYSGSHIELTSKEEGFYLSHNGLSIGSYFEVDTSGIPVIRLGHEAGKIYSGRHSTLNDLSKGFYLGNDGLSLYNSIRITAKDDNGKIEVGKITKDNKRHWTIGGKLGEVALFDEVSGTSYSKDYFIGQRILRNRKLYEFKRNVRGPHMEFFNSDGTILGPNGILVSLSGDGLLHFPDGRSTSPKFGPDGRPESAEIPGDIINVSEDLTNIDKLCAQKYTYDEPNYTEEDYGIYLENHKKGDLILVRRKLYEMLKDVTKNQIIKGTSDKNPDFKDVDEDDSHIQKYDYKTDYSYIAYGVEELAIEDDNNTDLMGIDYKTIQFKDEASTKQVYLGTDGLRIGKTFAVKDGNAFFKGTVEADYGNIGGWSISKEGLYYSFTKEDESDTFFTNISVTNEHPNPTNPKLIAYRKIFLMKKNGDIGICYVYRGTEEIEVKYSDGKNKVISKTLKENDLIPTPMAADWFDNDSWRGLHDGTFDIYAKDSHFGAGLWIEDQGKTYFNGRFGPDAQQRINEAVNFDPSNYYVISDFTGEKLYLQS